MTISEAIKNLAVAIKGNGDASDINEKTIAQVIQYMADNWADISSGIGGGGSVTVDTIGGATDTGKALMKAADAAAARNAIGAGTPYTLTAATTSAIGGVKQGASVTAVSAADAASISAEYTQAEVQAIATLANANKMAINAIITNLKAAGVIA